jgi:hypothetical protein
MPSTSNIRRTSASLASCVAALVLSFACALPFGPGCREESEPVLDLSGSVPTQGTVVHMYTVTWSQSSNLGIVLSWPWSDPRANLQLRATVTDCGEHVGCAMISRTATTTGLINQVTFMFEASLLVDATKGKTWRVEVLGDPVKDQPYRLVPHQRNSV